MQAQAQAPQPWQLGNGGHEVYSGIPLQWGSAAGPARSYSMQEAGPRTASRHFDQMFERSLQDRGPSPGQPASPRSLPSSHQSPRPPSCPALCTPSINQSGPRQQSAGTITC